MIITSNSSEPRYDLYLEDLSELELVTLHSIFLNMSTNKVNEYLSNYEPHGLYGRWDDVGQLLNPLMGEIERIAR